jgi:carboxylesterase type B
MYPLSLTALAAVVALAIPSHCNPVEGGLTVSTQQGPVKGTLISNKSVRQFLGIAYATAQRWSAPSKPPTRSNAFDATQLGNSCFQAPDAVALAFEIVGLGGGNITESEECLSVDTCEGEETKTAVMIWIHGGSLQRGSVRCFHWFFGGLFC